MKKQFAIKPAQIVKSVAQAATKVESTNLLKFLAAGPRCCSEWDLDPNIVAIPKPY